MTLSFKNRKAMDATRAEESSSSDESYSDAGRDKKRHKSMHRHRGRDKRHTGMTWGSKLEFLLACIGFSAGLSNIWRFPYTAFKSGGGIFKNVFYMCFIYMYNFCFLLPSSRSLSHPLLRYGTSILNFSNTLIAAFQFETN